jgi:hypothetical protein
MSLRRNHPPRGLRRLTKPRWSDYCKSWPLDPASSPAANASCRAKVVAGSAGETGRIPSVVMSLAIRSRNRDTLLAVGGSDRCGKGADRRQR